MKKLAMIVVAILTNGLVQADKLHGVDEMICALSQVHLCIENDTCYSVTAAELDVPDFVIVNTRKKTISTTPASELNRSTPFTTVQKTAGLIILQGIEGTRAFSIVIDEESGRMTVAVARDGISVSVFGACTDTDI